MSTAIAKNFQVGADGTATNNFTIRQPATPDGTVRIANGNTGSTTDLVTLTSAGNLGVGTSSPQGKIHAFTSSSGAAPSANANQLVVESSGNAGVTIASGATSVGNLFFADSGDNADGYVQYDQSGRSMRFGVAAAERARIDSSGNLLVGTTSLPTTNCRAVFQHAGNFCSTYVTGGTGTAYMLGFYNGNGLVGRVETGPSSTSYVTSSDYRLKENIQPMTGALEKVAALKPVTYKWKVDGSDGQGFIAHELQEVVPDCVSGEKDSVDADGNPVYQGIDTSFLVATLTAAIQEQQAIITAQAAQIQQLREKVLEVEEGTSNMLVENTNNLYETITALTDRVEALEAAKV